MSFAPLHRPLVTETGPIGRRVSDTCRIVKVNTTHVIDPNSATKPVIEKLDSVPLVTPFRFLLIPLEPAAASHLKSQCVTTTALESDQKLITPKGHLRRDRGPTVALPPFGGLHPARHTVGHSELLCT